MVNAAIEVLGGRRALMPSCLTALQVYGYALFKNGGHAVVKYPTEGFAEDVAGRSFHHGKYFRGQSAAL